MAYDAGIILQGQPVNVLGAMADGNRLAAQTQELQRQNALSALYKSQGAGIVNGDPGALNALAQYDPNAALGIKQQQQGMAFDAEKMGMLREEAKNAAADRAKALTAEQRAAEAAKLEAGLKGAAFFYQKGDRQGYTNFIQQQGLDPNEFTFDSFPAHAAQIDGVLEAYKTFAPEVPKPQSPAGKLAADLKAGLIDQPAYDAGIASLEKGGVNIDMGGGTNKQIFDAMSASNDTATAAITGLNAIKEAKKAVEGGIISGAMADQKLGLQKIGAALGVTDPAAIVNTETFRSAIAPQIAAMMKATVGSTQISNADREFAEKAAGGSISLDEASIKRLIGIMEKAGTAVVQRHMDKLNRVYPEGKGFDRERALFGVTLPDMGAVVPPPAPETTTTPDVPLPPDLQGVFDKYK